MGFIVATYSSITGWNEFKKPYETLEAAREAGMLYSYNHYMLLVAVFTHDNFHKDITENPIEIYWNGEKFRR